jgi:hypothetical protein
MAREAVKDATKKIHNSKEYWEEIGPGEARQKRTIVVLPEKEDEEPRDKGPLKDSDHNTITEDGGMANMLNKYVWSVFTQEGAGPVQEEGR